MPEILPNLGPSGRLDNQDRSYFQVGDIPVSHGPDFIKFAFGSLLQAALARTQQGIGVNSSINEWQDTTQPLEDAIGRTRGVDFANLLGNAAVGSTSNAVATGLEAARASGGGGGFNRGLAMRAATQAGAVQSSTVADALMRGTLGKMEQENSLASALTQARMGKAGALTNLNLAESDLSMQIAQLLSGLAGVGQQMDASRAANKTNVLTTGISAFGGMASSAMTGGAKR